MDRITKKRSVNTIVPLQLTKKHFVKKVIDINEKDLYFLNTINLSLTTDSDIDITSISYKLTNISTFDVYDGYFDDYNVYIRDIPTGTYELKVSELNGYSVEYLKYGKLEYDNPFTFNIKIKKSTVIYKFGSINVDFVSKVGGWRIDKIDKGLIYSYPAVGKYSTESNKLLSVPVGTYKLSGKALTYDFYPTGTDAIKILFDENEELDFNCGYNVPDESTYVEYIIRNFNQTDDLDLYNKFSLIRFTLFDHITKEQIDTNYDTSAVSFSFIFNGEISKDYDFTIDVTNPGLKDYVVKFNNEVITGSVTNTITINANSTNMAQCMIDYVNNVSFFVNYDATYSENDNPAPYLLLKKSQSVIAKITAQTVNNHYVPVPNSIKHLSAGNYVVYASKVILLTIMIQKSNGSVVKILGTQSSSGTETNEFYVSGTDNVIITVGKQQ